MAESAGFETARDLVLRVRGAGFDPGSDQIARWNRDGLLPKPYQYGLGRGRGSEIRYPAGTGDQLLALCRIHAQFRKLGIVGWYLWLNNYEVNEKYWRRHLEKSATYFHNNRHLFKTKLFNAALGIVSIRRSGQKHFERLPNQRSENRHFRRARRRVGAGQIGEFTRILLTIAIGEYRAEADPSEETNAAERRTIERGLGFTGARTDRLPNGQPLLTDSIEPVLEQLSSRLAKVTKATMFQAISSGKIHRTRDELRYLLTGLRSAYLYHKNKRGKNAFGLGGIAEFATLSDIKLQALFILLFETDDPGNMARLREIYRAIQTTGVVDGRYFDLRAPR
jgi:hypothetical protein